MMRHRFAASRNGIGMALVHPHQGYSLVEVLVSMVILLVGILAILNFFPQSLRANANAAIRAQAALLAQAKAEEVRRDSSASTPLIQTIRTLTVPTTPVPFVEDSRLSYSFCGVSLLAPVDNPGDPRDDYGVARVIVRYNQAFRPSEDILFELRFAE